MSAGVVFLDFDGPIFPSKVFLYPENNGEISAEKCKELELHPYVTYWKADPNSIVMLNKLHEIYPYELVISSSWADDWLHKKQHIEGVLCINNLQYTFHNEWKTPRDKFHTRHEQIGHWLKKNPNVDKYIILDDHSSGDSLADETSLNDENIKKDSVFLVDIHEGITYDIYQKMRKIINDW